MKHLFTIGEARRRAGLKQTDVAEKVGIDHATLSVYERYVRRIPIHTAKQLACLYGLTMDDIVWDAEELDDIRRGLEALGITDSKNRVEYESVGGRVKVTVDGEYLGIWDTLRRTFVD